MESNLAFCRRVNGEEHPDTHLAIGDLASYHADAGDFDKAIEMLESSLAICKRVLGEDYGTTLKVEADLQDVGQRLMRSQYLSTGDNVSTNRLKKSLKRFTNMFSSSSRQSAT
jgi:hypothetical protein